MRRPDRLLDAPNWAGSVNAWRVRDGLWRMGRAEWVTTKGWATMADQGVRTVVDLRSVAERGRRPTDPVAVELPAEIRHVHAPVEDPDHTEFWAWHDPYPNHPKYYQNMVETFPALVGSAVATTLQAWDEHGVVVHCSAGRDRTGLVLALLLQLPQIPGGAASWAEQARNYAAGTYGINDYRRTATTPHPVERYIPPDDYDRQLRDRLSALHQFLNQWPAEKVQDLFGRPRR